MTRYLIQRNNNKKKNKLENEVQNVQIEKWSASNKRNREINAHIQNANIQTLFCR